MNESTPSAFDEFQRLLAGLPEGLGGSIELLLSELSPVAAAALRLAAIPHQFDQALLAVLDPALEGDERERVYDELANLSISIEAGDGFAIHDSARAYLFRQWLQPDRRRDFAEVSARLAAHFTAAEAQAAGGEKTAAERGRIFHLIGCDPDAGFAAFEVLLRKERLRFRLHACEALIRLVHEYDEVLTPAQRLRLSFHEAKLNLDLKRYDEAEALLLQLQRDNQDDVALKARTLFRLGRLRHAQRRFPEALAVYNEALALARSHPAARAQELRVLQCLAVTHADMKQLDRATALLGTAIGMAESLGERQELAACHNSLGILQRRLSEPDQAVASFRRSLDCLSAEDTEFRTAQVHNNLGLAFADLAQWQEARESMERGLEIARKAGDTDGQATAIGNLARVYLGLQRRGEAIAASEQAVSLFLQAHNWFGAAATAEGLANLYRRERRIPETRAALAQAATHFRRAGEPARAARCEETARNLERRGRLPWYAIALLVIFVLLLVLVVIAAILEADTV